MVPGRPQGPELEVPRLLRLVRPAAAQEGPGRGRRSRTRRPASGPSTRRPASTTCTASTSTSPTSTWPTRWSATRSPRSWASGSSSGCPASGSTRCRSSWRPWGCRTGTRRCPTRTSTCATCGRCSTGGSATRSCSARSTCAPRPAAVLRRAGGRRAAHAVRLHRDAAALPVAGPERLRSPGRGPGDPPAAAAGEPVGQLRPQPRRADPGQAERGRAAGGVRRLRAGAGDAGLRPRPDPPAAADARRRHPPDQDGLQPAVRPARHPGAVLRRGDRDGREPGRRRPAGGADPDAVVGRGQRRVLQRPGRTSCPGSCPRGRTGRSSSTSPTSSATRTRC